ncbi:hypothetical protein GCM10029964_011000 [Kibdelosporangium lantanae]
MPKLVLMPVFDGLQTLDLTGPLEVFTGASRYLGSNHYEVVTASVGGRPIVSRSGLRIVPDLDIADAPRPHTLVVPGGYGTQDPQPDLIAWLRASAPKATRIVSVCSGAFLLAQAGLLDGHRATTHWSVCADLAASFPDIDVDPEPIFVRDGKVSTSAGVTSGIDLALALVEEDMGREAALTIARHLVMFLRRPGNQTQFSAQLTAQTAERRPLRDVQQWITEHPDAELSVDALAERANLSPRQFARVFTVETGMTPGRYVDRVRLEAARRQLEDSDAAITRIAKTCGYGTTESMRRAFVRTLGVSPPNTAAGSDTWEETVKIALFVYEGFTALDIVGPYEVLAGLPGADVVFVGEQRGPVTAHTQRLTLTADASIDEVPEADILVIPGGPGQRNLMADGPVHDWIRQLDTGSKWTTSVCTGSLILAATGLLKGRKATSHWLALEELRRYDVTPTLERVVFQDKYVTAAGVSAGIDMALTLAAKVADEEVAQRIQLVIEYDPQPPFDAGSPTKAPAEMVEALRAQSRFILEPKA